MASIIHQSPHIGNIGISDTAGVDQNQHPHSRSPTRPDRDRYYRQHALHPRSGVGQAGPRLRCRPRGACPSSIAWKPPGRVSRVRGGYNGVGMPLGPLGPVTAPSPGGSDRVFSRRLGSRIFDRNRSAGSRLLLLQARGGRRFRSNRHHPLRFVLYIRFNRCNRTPGRRDARSRSTRRPPRPAASPRRHRRGTAVRRFRRNRHHPLRFVLYFRFNRCNRTLGRWGVTGRARRRGLFDQRLDFARRRWNFHVFLVFRSQFRLGTRAGAGFRLGTRASFRSTHCRPCETSRRASARSGARAPAYRCQQHGLFHRRGPGRFLDLGP